MKKNFIFFAFFFCLLGRSDGHDDDDLNSFAGRIYAMCAGHHHLSEKEFQEVSNQLGDHLADLDDLVTIGDNDRYYKSLIIFVSLSETITNERKRNVYRGIADRAMKEFGHGEEWDTTLLDIVRKGGVLKDSELVQLERNSTSPYLKGAVEGILMKRQRASERRQPLSSEKNPDIEGIISSDDLSNEIRVPKESFNFPWIIAGALFVGSLLLLLKIFKGKSTS